MIYCSILIGILIPYFFSAMNTKSISKTVERHTEVLQEQITKFEKNKLYWHGDHGKCIEETLKTAFQETWKPLLMALGIPLIFGIFFHPILLLGFLPGAALSGFQLAVTLANTCGPWDNTKQMISRLSMSFDKKRIFYKHKHASVNQSPIIGEVLGDSLNDSSGPSLNLLIKFMSIVSMVFASIF